MNNQDPQPIDGRSANAEESVARLLRLAGHRPAAPARDAAIVKEAARAEWRRVVKAQRRRKKLYFGGAGGLLAAAALLVLVLNPRFQETIWPAASGPLATVVASSGDVQISGEEGGGLGAGATVETAAGAARAILQLADGSMVRIDADTHMRLTSRSELNLDRGAVYVDSGPGSGSLAVRTPMGVARDIGTRFEVRLLEEQGAALSVSVLDGKVILDHEGDSRTAEAGQQMGVRADGTLWTGAIPPGEGPQSWILDILPHYENEDRSTGAFLDWVANECGFELEFADQALRAEVSPVVRHGDVTGMSLDFAVSAALLGGPAIHRVEDGKLRVERVPATP